MSADTVTKAVMNDSGRLDEKSASSSHREHAPTTEGEGYALEFDNVETSRVLRKVDWRLLPVLSFLYLLAFLDRSNLGNAKVAGLADDLELTGGQYNMSATVECPLSSAASDLRADDCPGVLFHLLLAGNPGKCHAQTTEAVSVDWMSRRGLGYSTCHRRLHTGGPSADDVRLPPAPEQCKTTMASSSLGSCSA